MAVRTPTGWVHWPFFEEVQFHVMGLDDVHLTVFCPIQGCNFVHRIGRSLEAWIDKVWLIKHHIRTEHKGFFLCPSTYCERLFGTATARDAHVKLRRHKFLGTCTVAGCEGTVYAYRDKGNLYDHLHERHPGIAEEYLSGGYAMRSPIRFYMQLLPLDRLGDEPKEPTDQANEVNPNCEGTEVVEDRVRAVDKQFFKSKHVHEEMKLYSTEIPPHSERRLAPPRDSLEPTSFGTPRGSNKMIWNPTRHTDELVERNPLRHTDELIETRAFDTSSLEPQLTSVEIKAESERLRRS